MLGLVIFLFFSAVLSSGYFIFFKKRDLGGLVAGRFGERETPQVVFLNDVYDTVKEEYWKKLTDEQIADLFRRGAEKISGDSYELQSADKQVIKDLFLELSRGKSDEEKDKLATTLAQIVLANLEPFGRSRLYDKEEALALGNRVNNVEPDSNYYGLLGVEKSAGTEEIQRAYEAAVERLVERDSPEAGLELNRIKLAYQTLSSEESRKLYDKYKVAPTVSYQKLSPQIFYAHIKKFSPLTLQEFKLAADSVDQGEELDTLILDLRNNVGGAIDGLPKFLGPFIGNDRYAYQFFRRGERVDYKTKIGWLPSLVRYKKVVILVNEKTQSSAEVFASALKNYNVGVLVGKTTKGWGTVEKVLPIESQLNNGKEYYILLVHSVTLRADGKSVEGNGVRPLINIENDGWEQELLSYFDNQTLVEAVREQIFGESLTF